jgi:RNA polymerase sigma-70 factor (ECF subfamily)
LKFLAESQSDSRLSPHADLSGVVQQSLLEAHKAASEGKVNVTLPWLRRILANNLTDEIRRLHSNKRDVRRERSLASAIEQSSIQLEAMLNDSLPSPSDNFVQQEDVLMLSAALDRLPETQRQALVLQVWQGWTLAQIAEHMGKTQQAVAGLLKRGLRQLRQEMRAGNTSSPD